jgi:1,4-alpha-glucan branching enzyme
MVKITKKGKKAWVTFTVDGDGSDTMNIKGEWNEWSAEPMKRKKNGDFYIMKILPTGRAYRFGYENGEGRWMTEEALPKEASPFGSENSILEL